MYDVKDRSIISLHLERGMPELHGYIILPELCFQTDPDAIIITAPSGHTRYALIDHEYELDAWDIPLLARLLGFDPGVISEDFRHYWADGKGDVDVPSTVYRIHEVGAVELLAQVAR